MNYINWLVGGAILYSVLLYNFLPCGIACREAYIRTATSDHEWSRQIWEEIATRIEDEKKP